MGGLVQDPKEKASYYRAALALRPDSAMAYDNLGLSLHSQGDLAAARLCHQKALELDPKYATAHNNLGWVLYRLGELERAVASYHKALEYDPKHPYAHNNLGVIFNQKGDYDRAIAHLKKAIEIYPKYVFAHNNLSFAYGRIKDYDNAILHLKKVIQLDPKNQYALSSLGWNYAGKGTYEKALAYLQKGIELDSKSALSYFRKGFVLGETGNLKQACQAIKKALELPRTLDQSLSWRKTLNKLESLLALEPRLPEIVKGELKPKDFQEALHFGMLCGVKQDYTSAARLFEKAAAIDPDSAKKMAPFEFLAIARVNLLAAEGKGNEPPPEADRPKNRAKALAWLRQYVHWNEEELDSDRKAARYIVQGNMRVLLQHKDFAGVRPLAHQKLLEGERTAWEGFWADVNRLLQKTETSMADAPKK